MKLYIPYTCDCEHSFTVGVDYTPVGSPHSIGDYGPEGAVFCDPSEIDITENSECPKCNEPVVRAFVHDTADDIYSEENESQQHGHYDDPIDFEF
jgi:hypothetical protein